MRSFLGAFALAVCTPRVFPQEAAPAPNPPGREVSLSRSEVKDTFFAYVLGIIKAGVEMDIDNAAMRSILSEFKTSLDLPFDLITRVTQHTEQPGGTRTIGLEFGRAVSIPIPFSLLFYHPGSIVASRIVTFSVEEGTVTDPADTAPGPVFVLTLSDGSILVDIDDWLEVLFRVYIEDTWIRRLVFFRWRGDWVGLLEGAGRGTNRSIRAYFDFTRNSIVFPTPEALDRQGRSFLR